jgi:UDP-N-acetylglucosamine 4,6-dehydratase/5-epimerase
MSQGFDNQVILVTGGTGSFGQKFIETVLSLHRPRKLIVFSRDEVKQLDMMRRFPESRYPAIRCFIGDVRDRERLHRAFEGVDVVVHAAALKQVPTAEYNPLEVIKTNVIGAANIIDAAIDCGVRRVIALSSDKAVNPINLYGATKLCADKLFIGAGVYAGARETRFAVVRYGNVIGSRGSVIPLFLEQRGRGVLPITDPRMTRFWIGLDQAVAFVINCLGIIQGGEIFVPKLPSMRLIDLARAIGPECRHDIVGIRPGEKLHEVLLTEDESRRVLEFDDMFIVNPGWLAGGWANGSAHVGRPVPENFRYSSETNDRWLTVSDLRAIANIHESTDESSDDTLRAAVG